MNEARDFFVAAQQNATGTISSLLDEGQNANATDTHGVTALIYAAREGHVDVINILLDHGAEIDGLGKNQQLTPLQQAAWNNHLDCAQLLIERGADINADYGKQGWTPLMYALDELASPDIARLLIEHGANVNIENQGETALEVAAMYGADDLVQLLKQFGAKARSH